MTFTRSLAARLTPVHAWIWLTLQASPLQAADPASTTAAPWERMNYGSFLSSSVTLPAAPNAEDVHHIALKAVTVKLGGNLGSACFDTATLRYAAVWTGGWLALHGTPFDGNHRPPEKSRPIASGSPLFKTTMGPGATPDGDWRDLRSEPYIPIPKERAQYRGLFVHGNQVMFHYTVGKTAILETPSMAQAGTNQVFQRDVWIAPHSAPLELLVTETSLELRNHVAFNGDQPSDHGAIAQLGRLVAGLHGDATGAQWVVLQGQRLALRLPPSKVARQFQIHVALASRDQLRTHLQNRASPSPESLQTAQWIHNAAQWIQTGKGVVPTTRRWPQEIITEGKPGSTGASYEVDLITLPYENPWNSWMKTSGFDFFSDGTRAALCTWQGDVWLAQGLDEKLSHIRWTRFASGLFQPLGLRIRQNEIFVLCRDQITRLRDLDGDGEADYYECFNNDVSVTPNFHEFALDLHTDSAGNFYFTKGAPLLGTDYWDPTSAHNGSLLKVSADGRTLTRYATGLRAPNGSGVGPHNEITCSDNEGIWTPVCRLNWVKPGGFYGAVGMDHRDAPPTSYDPPLCWLPFAVDNSSGSQVWASPQFGPLSQSLIHLSYGKCRAFLVLHEEVAGIQQGGVVPLPWKFDSSAMRGRVNPSDGSLYVCGLKGWQTSAARDGAWHRIRYTGKPERMLIGLKTAPPSVQLEFSAPLDPASVSDLQAWDAQCWNYRWSKSYGSDLYSVETPGKVVGKKGELKGDTMELVSTQLSPDHRKVTLHFKSLPLAMQWMLRATLKWEGGESCPVTYYGTLNAKASR